MHFYAVDTTHESTAMHLGTAIVDLLITQSLFLVTSASCHEV